MQLYTGTPGGSLEKMKNLKKYSLGVAISAEPRREYKTLPCFIDNGAYTAWKRGMPWSETRFFALLERCWACGLSADFIVCPDIVAGGRESLNFSWSWVHRLRPARLALAVQDGMDFDVVDHLVARRFTHIFVGGTLEWKWETAKTWVEVAHARNMKCHIGRCGGLEQLKKAFQYGADSADSTSWVRNESWHIVEEFTKWMTSVKQ